MKRAGDRGHKTEIRSQTSEVRTTFSDLGHLSSPSVFIQHPCLSVNLYSSSVFICGAKRKRHRQKAGGASKTSLIKQDESLALAQHHHFPLVISQIDLPRTGDLLLGILHHFHPLSKPSRRAADGEQHREHVHREPERLIDQA